jgi:hypothetical protein
MNEDITSLCADYRAFLDSHGFVAGRHDKKATAELAKLAARAESLVTTPETRLEFFRTLYPADFANA